MKKFGEIYFAGLLVLILFMESILAYLHKITGLELSLLEAGYVSGLLFLILVVGGWFWEKKLSPAIERKKHYRKVRAQRW